LIDPAVVKLADMAAYEGVIGKLLQDIEAAKAGNTQQPPAQSGQDSVPNTGTADTAPSTTGNTAPPRPKIDPATGNNPDADDAWNRLLNYK
jgi:hypothetical protein